MKARLSDRLAHWSARASAREAIVDLISGHTLTWAQYQSSANSLARRLYDAGVREGDRVAVAVPRTCRYLIALVACWLVGAVAVPLDSDSPELELEGFLNHAEVRGYITDDMKVRSTCARTPDRSPPGDALLLYTSGSTGSSKAARLTHRAIASSLRGLSSIYRLGPRSRLLGTLPICTSHGLFVHGLSPLIHGGTLVLADHVGTFTARRVWQIAREHGITFFSTVPSVLGLIARLADETPCDGMTVACASAPLTPEVRTTFEERFRRRVINSFGMSEASGWCLYGTLEQPPASAGRPTRCHIRVAETDSHGVGELQLRGTQLTCGYWRSEAAAFTADGWFRSGDLVRLDEEGWVYVVGRVKRVIRPAGRSLHAENVEAALLCVPGVLEAAVVGVPHAVVGEAPRAFVVPAPGACLEVPDLFAALRRRLASYRLPFWIDVCDRLPRTRGGKPDLVALANMPLRSSVASPPHELGYEMGPAPIKDERDDDE